MDPIALTIALSGGEAAILQVSVVPSAGLPLMLSGAPIPAPNEYDPAAEADYAPTPPTDFPVIGVTESKIEFDAGATGAFTFQASAMPVGLDADGTTLLWRGLTWRVLKYRERRWMGQINGYTLQLAI